MHTQWLTYERCKRVHCEAGAHHNQQICFRKVCLHLLKEPRWQALSKENYVGLDKTLCNPRVVISTECGSYSSNMAATVPITIPVTKLAHAHHKLLLGLSDFNLKTEQTTVRHISAIHSSWHHIPHVLFVLKYRRCCIPPMPHQNTRYTRGSPQLLHKHFVLPRETAFLTCSRLCSC